MFFLIWNWFGTNLLYYVLLIQYRLFAHVNLHELLPGQIILNLHPYSSHTLITSLSSPTTSYIQIIFQRTTTKASKPVWSELGNKPGGEKSEMLSSVTSHPPHNGIIRTNLSHWVTASTHLTTHGLRGAIHWQSVWLYLPFKWVSWCLASVTIQPRPLEVTTQRKEWRVGTAL